MNVLGVSFGYHDASAALVRDGALVWAGAEERYSGLRHDPNLPRRAMAEGLRTAGLRAADLDAVVLYEEPFTKLPRVLVSTLAAFPRGAGRFARAARDWITDRLWAADQVARALDVPADRVQVLPHHHSHAAQAFRGSPFAEAAILTVDAVGEWACTGLARGGADGVRMLETFDYPSSLGLFYAAFTGFIGFRPNDGECSTMALAAFGRPTRVDDVRRILRLHDDGTYEVVPGWFDFTSDQPYTARFLARFGAPRDHRAPLPFDSFADAPVDAGDAQRWADLAASVQLVLEEALLGLARRLHRLTALDALCLAGGVAMNSVAIARLEREGPFRHVFVPPDPGDGGAAVGAALHVAEARAPWTPYLGAEWSDDDALALVREVGDAPFGGALRVTRVGEAERVERVVEALRAGKVAAWVQGRAEHGPRALGHRSLLFDPSRVDVARRVSREVKSRAPFRPYALSAAAEQADRLLDGHPPGYTAAWMQTVRPLRDPARVRAGAHVDGTTRPQICAAEQEPRYHGLLSAWSAATGTPALVNTSFNGRGLPIVESPVDALAQFARARIDLLVLGDHLLERTADV